MANKPHRCKVCDHKLASTINAKLRSGQSVNSIHKETGIARNTLSKHKKECLAKLIASDNKARDLMAGEALLKQVQEQIALVRKMVLACDEWLTDPDNPDKYFLGPRGDEIDITYQEVDEDTGRLLPSQRKATMQEMLQAIESSGYIIRGVKNNHADPRDLLLRAITKLEGTVKMINDSSQKLIEWEHKKKALDKVANEGGTISFEQMVEKVTQRVTIAYEKTNSEELSDLAGLPKLD